MSYAQIDPILQPWAANHGLTMMTAYKDYEVRSVDFTNEEGSRFQLWVDPPGEDGRVGVHVWDYRKRRADYWVTIQELAHFLNEALRVVSGWSSVCS